MTDLILLGYIIRSFGIKGGVVVKLLNETSDSLVAGKKVILRQKKLPEQMLTIASTMHGGRVFFAEITDITTAQSLKGAELFIHRSDLPSLSEDEFYLLDLLGARVIESDGKECGVIVGFSDNNAQVLFEIQTVEGHRVSIPAVKPIVQKIDYEKKLVIIDPPSGLLDPLD